ncbi:MAG: 16S rRNA (uracil(1498)-N(3))-methyltransferase [Burkholderiaceae bacterium]
MPRFHCPTPLQTGEVIALPAGAARHVQVLRMQPGGEITLFNGGANQGEFEATIEHMGRNEVRVLVGAHSAVERESARRVHLIVGVPANDRMDWLVEKATELGVASIQPVMTERSVLRLSGERSDKKRAHWQAVAVAACEQCGRNQVPVVHEVMALNAWLAANNGNQEGAAQPLRYLLSLRPETQALNALVGKSTAAATFLSGPEGGLSVAEEDAALAKGFQPVSLGNRVLRAETAGLAALTLFTA